MQRLQISASAFGSGCGIGGKAWLAVNDVHVARPLEALPLAERGLTLSEYEVLL